ncbi:DapH/DapD/GlmU-related protein [Nodularia spumigena]|nr:DapH/DapD/GlmU-related protein [Nodularia spumigena]
MKKLIGIFGFGGFGREVIPLVEQQVAVSSQFQASTRIVFVDEVNNVGEVNGYEVMSFDNFCSDNAQSKEITIAVGNCSSRKLIYQRVCNKNIPFLSVTALNSVQLQSVDIGEGSILCPFTTITSNVKIGKCFQANIYSYVAHDCVIGDFVTFAPGVKCNGNVVIEDDVYVGTGAIIKQGKKGNPIILGKGSKIEAGSYVTKNVESGTTVFGNPAVKMTVSNLRKLKSSN